MVRDSEKDSVMLTIQRENEEKTRDVKVEIRDVEIQTVSHEMLSEDTGYIRISEFSEVTSDQYKKAFADLKDQGMKKLVVDLRDNPGAFYCSLRRTPPDTSGRADCLYRGQKRKEGRGNLRRKK
mgnify:CR=1 FL=1